MRPDDRMQSRVATATSPPSEHSVKEGSAADSKAWVERYVDRVSRILDKKVWPEDK